MNKFVALLLLISIISLMGCGSQNEVVLQENTQQQEQTSPVEVTKTPEKFVIQTKPTNGFYGQYTQKDNSLSVLSITDGSDSEHFNMEANLYRIGGFSVVDVEIDNKENEVVHAKKVISEEDMFIPPVDSNIGSLTMEVDINGEECTITFDKQLDGFLDSSYVFEKDTTPAITEEEFLRTNSYIAQNGIDNIENRNLLNVISNGDRFLTIDYLCDIDDTTLPVKGYYSFDKKEKKQVSLEDLMGANLNDVEEFIQQEIEKKKEDWNNGIFIHGDEIEDTNGMRRVALSRI